MVNQSDMEAAMTDKPSHYAWLITTDHLFDGLDAAEGKTPDIGHSGPHNAPDGLIADLEAGKGTKFKLYDDDGELYYTGRIITDGGRSVGDYCERPLDDFGKGWAGATEIRYPGHPTWNA